MGLCCEAYIELLANKTLFIQIYKSLGKKLTLNNTYHKIYFIHKFTFGNDKMRNKKMAKKIIKGSQHHRFIVQSILVPTVQCIVMYLRYGNQLGCIMLN